MSVSTTVIHSESHLHNIGQPDQLSVTEPSCEVANQYSDCKNVDQNSHESPSCMLEGDNQSTDEKKHIISRERPKRAAKNRSSSYIDPKNLLSTSLRKRKSGREDRNSKLTLLKSKCETASTKDKVELPPSPLIGRHNEQPKNRISLSKNVELSGVALESNSRKKKKCCKVSSSTPKLTVKQQLDVITDEKFVDITTPKSLLAKLPHLKFIVNQHNFQQLPKDARSHLMSLLPPFDTCDKSNEKTLNCTSLHNVFLTKACRIWLEKLSRSEFHSEYIAKLDVNKKIACSKIDPWKVSNFESIWGNSSAAEDSFCENLSSDTITTQLHHDEQISVSIEASVSKLIEKSNYEDTLSELEEESVGDELYVPNSSNDCAIQERKKSDNIEQQYVDENEMVAHFEMNEGDVNDNNNTQAHLSIDKSICDIKSHQTTNHEEESLKILTQNDDENEEKTNTFDREMKEDHKNDESINSNGEKVIMNNDTCNSISRPLKIVNISNYSPTPSSHALLNCKSNSVHISSSSQQSVQPPPLTRMVKVIGRLQNGTLLFVNNPISTLNNERTSHVVTTSHLHTQPPASSPSSSCSLLQPEIEANSNSFLSNGQQYHHQSLEGGQSIHQSNSCVNVNSSKGPYSDPSFTSDKDVWEGVNNVPLENRMLGGEVQSRLLLIRRKGGRNDDDSLASSHFDDNLKSQNVVSTVSLPLTINNPSYPTSTNFVLQSPSTRSSSVPPPPSMQLLQEQDHHGTAQLRTTQVRRPNSTLSDRGGDTSDIGGHDQSMLHCILPHPQQQPSFNVTSPSTHSHLSQDSQLFHLNHQQLNLPNHNSSIHPSSKSIHILNDPSSLSYHQNTFNHQLSNGHLSTLQLATSTNMTKSVDTPQPQLTTVHTHTPISLTMCDVNAMVVCSLCQLFCHKDCVSHVHIPPSNQLIPICQSCFPSSSSNTSSPHSLFNKTT